MNQSVKAFILSLSLLASFSAFAQQMGQAIPKDAQQVKLSEILKSPAKYKGKEVVLQGNYGSKCCATDFNYKEGLDGIEITPSGFDNWQNLKKGTPIKVYGVVNVIERGGGEKIVHMEAKGMETK
jgi:hypothetical protein